MSKSELHREIINLKHEVLDMGKLSLTMLEGSITSLNTRDLELAKEVLQTLRTGKIILVKGMGVLIIGMTIKEMETMLKNVLNGEQP